MFFVPITPFCLGQNGNDHDHHSQHHHHHHHTPARASPGTGRNCDLVGRCREQRRIESQVLQSLLNISQEKKI
jgi:hypothetical protein